MVRMSILNDALICNTETRGYYQTLLQGYHQIPHHNDEARYVILLESGIIRLVCA